MRAKFLILEGKIVLYGTEGWNSPEITDSTEHAVLKIKRDTL